MPYVPGFTNDIFVSFSHVDNLEGWVDAFQDQLTNRLLMLDARVTIWRDNKLRGTDVFSDEIFDQLQQSALLISIVSPRGIGSHWCEDERQAFERFAVLNGGFRFGNSLRAVKVVKTPLPGEKHRELFGVTGFEFYKRDDPQSYLFDEFDLTGREFRQLRDKLALEIKSVLDDFSEHKKNLLPKETVYVATTTSELTRKRHRILRELEDLGYAVVPQDAEPLRRKASFEAVAKAELKASILSVHLPSNQPELIDDEQDSISAQYELAQALPKDRIIWAEPDRQLHPQFLDAYERGLQKGVELVRDNSIEKIKEVITGKLKRLLQPIPIPPRELTSDLYLICDVEDHPERADLDGGQRALTVIEYLKKQGLLVIPSPLAQVEWNEVQKVLQAHLQLSNAILLFWGRASQDWFYKVQYIIAREESRRNQISNASTLTKAYYFSYPPKQDSLYKRAAEFVFEQYGPFEPGALKPLVDRLLDP